MQGHRSSPHSTISSQGLADPSNCRSLELGVTRRTLLPWHAVCTVPMQPCPGAEERLPRRRTRFPPNQSVLTPVVANLWFEMSKV